MLQLARRQLLGSVLSTVAGSSLLGVEFDAGEKKRPMVLASGFDGGRWHWCCFQPDSSHRLQWSYPLEGRVHGFSHHEGLGWVWAVERRPGTFLEIRKGVDGQLLHRLELKPGLFFTGHSCLWRRGGLLMAGVSDFENRLGGLAVWQLGRRKIERVGVYLGVHLDPHEMVMCGDQLVVAFGGVLTHPESGSRRLNLDSMESQLLVFDPVDGLTRPKRVMELPSQFKWRRSLRHLVALSAHEVMVACQVYDSINQSPLIYRARVSGSPTLIPLSDSRSSLLGGYCGSICHSKSSGLIAVSHPKSNRISVWYSDGTMRAVVPFRDGCGICFVNDHLLMSGVQQAFKIYDPVSHQILGILEPQSNIRAWDNHLHSFFI